MREYTEQSCCPKKIQEEKGPNLRRQQLLHEGLHEGLRKTWERTTSSSKLNLLHALQSHSHCLLLHSFLSCLHLIHWRIIHSVRLSRSFLRFRKVLSRKCPCEEKERRKFVEKKSFTYFGEGKTRDHDWWTHSRPVTLQEVTFTNLSQEHTGEAKRIQETPYSSALQSNCRKVDVSRIMDLPVSRVAVNGTVNVTVQVKRRESRWQMSPAFLLHFIQIHWDSCEDRMNISCLDS